MWGLESWYKWPDNIDKQSGIKDMPLYIEWEQNETKDDLNNKMNALAKHILTFVGDEDWILRVVKKETETLSIDDFQTNFAMSLTKVR